MSFLCIIHVYRLSNEEEDIMDLERSVQVLFSCGDRK